MIRNAKAAKAKRTTAAAAATVGAAGAAVAATTTLTVKTWQQRLKDNENILWLITGWAFAVFLPFYLDDMFGVDGWWGKKLMSPIGIAALIGLTLYGAMSAGNPAKPFRHTLAKIGIWVLVIVAAFHLFGGPVKAWYADDGLKMPSFSFLAPANAQALIPAWATQEIVVAPVGDFSPRVDFPGRGWIEFDGPVVIRQSFGEPFIYTGGELPGDQRTDYLEFKSPGNTPVKGVVSKW